VVDGNNRVLRFDHAASKANGANADGVLGQLIFTANLPISGAGGMAYPTGIAIDGSGTLWVGDNFDNRVLRFNNAASKPNGASADGVLGQPDFTSANAANSQNGLNSPNGVAIDSSGTLWVADTGNNRVLRFDNATTKANGANADGVLGQAGFVTKGSSATQTTLYHPGGVTVDASGSVWVADSYNNRVLYFVSATLPTATPSPSNTATAIITDSPTPTNTYTSTSTNTTTLSPTTTRTSSATPTNTKMQTSTITITPLPNCNLVQVANAVVSTDLTTTPSTNTVSFAITNGNQSIPFLVRTLDYRGGAKSNIRWSARSAAIDPNMQVSILSVGSWVIWSAAGSGGVGLTNGEAWPHAAYNQISPNTTQSLVVTFQNVSTDFTIGPNTAGYLTSADFGATVVGYLESTICVLNIGNVTPVSTSTPTQTTTPGITPSSSNTATTTNTVRPSATITDTPLPTNTVTQTQSATTAILPSSTNTITSTSTATPTPTSTITRTPTPTPTKIDTIGIYRNGTFYLSLHNATGNADIVAAFNPAGQNVPVVGDWTGAGFDTIGVFDQNTGVFSLRNTNTPGLLDNHFALGNPNDMPLSGRWFTDATHAGAGVYRPSNGILYVKNTLATGFADHAMVMGIPGDQSIAGDWTGKDFDSVGVYRPGAITFFLSNQITDGIINGDISLLYGASSDVAITGDWIGQGHDGVGTFRSSTGNAYLKNALTPGFADNAFFYGIAGDVPLAGHWQVLYPPVAPIVSPPVLTAKTSLPPVTPSNSNGGSVPGGNEIGG